MRVVHCLARILICSCAARAAQMQAQAPDSKHVRKDPVMTRHAEGTFDVKNVPLAADDATQGTPIGRYGLDKQFHGDLEATSKGEMMGGGDPGKGTAGYVAMEFVTGTLGGHSGSFALQHSGTMEGGRFNLHVVVVPGSGTGALAGISGTMNIVIAAGKHSYQFEYTLPDAAQ
jgi:Protein of unknown function (DUF3224)